MSDVLITYGWVRSSYNALRNLNNHGVSVAISDSSNIGMCQFSRLSASKDRYRSHYDDENKFISDILKICKNKNIKLILPSHNETEIIAKNKHKFDTKLVSAIPDLKHCKIFNNKSDAYNLVESLGIPVAKRAKYSNINDLEKILEKDGFKKTVIKLLTGNSSKGVFYADTPKEATTIVKKLIKEYDLNKSRYPQVEEYVEGKGYGCSVLYWKGKYITHFSHKRLREKISTGGTSTFREAAINQNIERATKKIFDSIAYNGLAMCEFKVCKKTGKYWFIEVNPRMWGSISLPIESGIEFPYLVWLCATKGPEAAISYDKNTKKKFPWKARWLLGDLFIIFNLLRTFKFKEVIGILKEEKANSFDDFFWNDPFVFVGEVLAYLKSTISKKSINPSEKGMIR